MRPPQIGRGPTLGYNITVYKLRRALPSKRKTGWIFQSFFRQIEITCQLSTSKIEQKEQKVLKAVIVQGFYSWEQPLKKSANWSSRDYSNWPLWVIEHLTLLLHFIGCQWPWWRTLRGGRTGGTRLATMPWRQKQWKNWLLAVSRCSKLNKIHPKNIKWITFLKGANDNCPISSSIDNKFISSIRRRGQRGRLESGGANLSKNDKNSNKHDVLHLLSSLSCHKI